MRAPLIVCLLFVALPQVAHAQVELVIDQPAKEWSLNVHPLQETVLVFDSAVTGIEGPDWENKVVVKRDVPTEVTIRPTVEREGYWGAMTIKTALKRTVTFKVHGVHDPKLAPAVYNIRTAELKEVLDTFVDARADEKCGPLVATTAVQNLDVKGIVERTRHADLLRRPRKVFKLDDIAPPGPAIGIRGTAIIEAADGKYHLELELTNRVEHPVTVTDLIAEDPVTGRSHTARATILDESHNGPVELKPGTTVPAIVELTSMAFVGKTVSVAVTAVPLERPVYRDGIAILDFSGTPDENIGWITLGIQGSLGMVWLEDGSEAIAADLETTLLKSLGVFFRRGMTRRIDLQIAAAYASTGEARFENVSLESGTQADLVRSARMVGLHIGGLLRVTTSGFMPVLQASVGAQGGFYDATLEGSTLDAPGDGFAFNLMWLVGLGVERRFGPCKANVMLSFEQLVSSDSRSIQGGLSFGCGWKGETDDE